MQNSHSLLGLVSLMCPLVSAILSCERGSSLCLHFGCFIFSSCSDLKAVSPVCKRGCCAMLCNVHPSPGKNFFCESECSLSFIYLLKFPPHHHNHQHNWQLSFEDLNSNVREWIWWWQLHFSQNRNYHLVKKGPNQLARGQAPHPHPSQCP